MANGQLQAADWAALIDQWRQSGLSLRAFCQQHGISRGTMQNWIYKPTFKQAILEARRQAFAPAADPGHANGPAPCGPSPTFLPVRVAQATVEPEESHHTGVEVVLGAGRRIVLGMGFDTETLRRVIAVLEGRSC
jgi:lambda repressor-like predicted transcriptional regulator